MTSATATALAATTLVVNAGGITSPILVGVVALLTSTVRNLYWLASDSLHFGRERAATSVIAVGVLTVAAAIGSFLLGLAGIPLIPLH